MEVERQEKSAVALVSVVSNASLVAFKLAVGLAIGSVSVVSEAIHSGVDLAAALIAWFAVRKSGSPADREHPFGHGKVENISGVVEALLIFVAAGWIVWEAAKKLIHRSPVEAVGWGVAVMLISSITNILVSRRLFEVGHRTQSAALLADGWHLRTDVYTSAGVMVGLGVMWVGDRFFPGIDLSWVDPVAAILVALLIIKAAYQLTVDAGRDLLDARLPDMEEKVIREVLASFPERISGFHQLKTRKSGNIRFVEFHIQVAGQTTVLDAHRFSHELADMIRGRLPGTMVNIHVEPKERPPQAL